MEWEGLNFGFEVEMENGIERGGGTSDYTQLSNKPQINGVTLQGNKTASDLGLASEEDIPSLTPYRTASAQDVIDAGKVDKVTGKGLSKNDYTDADKQKVANAITQHQDISGKADTSTVNAIGTRVTTIESKIPNQATSSNQLGDKNFINSSINSVTAFYITKNAQGEQFNTHAELQSATTFYSGGEVRVPTRNDYCIVLVDEDKQNATTRYIYQNGQWEYQYTVNETALTAVQLSAINSGITSELVSIFNAKQDALVSGANIKTLNNTSLLGSGNIDIEWGSIGGTLADQTDLQSALDDKQDSLPSVVNNRYLHTNSSTGALEWSGLNGEVIITNGCDLKIEDATLQTSLVAVFGNSIVV